MSLSNLAPFRYQTNNNAVSKDRGRQPTPAPAAAAPVAVARSVSTDTQVREQPRVAVEQLTAADVRDLSFATIGLLTPINPKLVADLIINAGKMRRAELPMTTVAMRPAARAILLCGELRRGHQLNDADRGFLDDYLDEIGAR